MLYAEVAVEAARALDRETYSYTVPEGVDVVPGHRVTVPFGRRTTFGYVVSLGTDEPGVETKPISSAGREPLLLPHQVALARLVADHYWVPLIECLRAMLPPRVRSAGSNGGGASTRQRRHSRLLEKLREVRRKDWEEAVNREFEALAAETYLARWAVSKPRTITIAAR